MAKTIEPRSLIQDALKTVEINDEIKSIFQKWETLFNEKSTEESSKLDAFFAGWIMANPMVRDQFKGK